MTASLRIVGLGPGKAGWITEEALLALGSAEHIVGYHTYLARLPPFPGKTLHGSDNGDELMRARQALDLTRGGARVALVSGGDPGVFAMAAAVFEAVEQGPLSLRELDIAVLPGVTAMLAAAARLGAMLGNDFCAINLSDNLKSWSTIERRLTLAAQADFVIALYNPASRARGSQIHRAFAVLSRHRTGQAVVAFARAVGREDEALIVTTLAEADPERADMQTLVLVGNAFTRRLDRPCGTPWVYTPRTVPEAP